MVKMKYFDKYVEMVESGLIPVSIPTKLEIERIKRFKKQYIFKQDEADKRIKFIEEECSNTKGQSGKLKLALPQKVWLESAWGFYHEALVTKTNHDTLEEYQITEERRLIHEVPIIVPRGTGKTTLGSAIGEVGQIIDGEYGADIQLLAYSREQAGFLFNASRAMLSNEDSLLYYMREADVIRSTKQGILYETTNSLMSIKTSDYESLDGTNAHYNIFDEVHTYDDDFIKVVNDGSSRKRKNWMTWYISTNGTKRDKLFDRYYSYWMDVLTGKVTNDSVMPWIYKLDDVSEINNPDLWMKAMPLLGITTEKETIAQDIESSRNDPAKQAELMAKTFNLPINNYLAYFTNDECKGWIDKFDASLFKGDEDKTARCVLGADLSDVNDICSISFMIVNGEERQYINKKYMPRQTIDSLPRDQQLKYLEWETKGLLHIHELDYNDQRYIFDNLREFMNEQHILPIAVGYDRWNAKELVRLFNDYYGDICYDVPQTVKNLSSHLKVYKEKAKMGKIIFDDEVSTWNHSNVMVKVDANGNIFPNKAKAKDKIDVFASQLDAFIVYEQHREDLAYYYE
ncbi:terminase TerL endonuclease subunit [Streptococcus parauberis]|uniref:Putative phage terminase, large subunit n=1 Tax=Streptococcus parauberis NCFD 2020 TaxID=873447 RepID=F1Z0P3_9STRE|nr:terminase TerL endonuclease subunit [Streptococcus parauberis]EGE54246.1 putative phage terminase, large subunit [Streptococcus parauberis NCFD 2020]QBX18329.1 terminase large subunit [Streptococcus phage Javan411]QBX27616.1 terminase large subunit [Streptococcus phage Javan400]